MALTTLDRQIVGIALPAFAALVSEPAMLLADTAIVGRLGRAELAGLGAASTALVTVVGLCIFLAYGSTASVARQQGAGRSDEALREAFSGLWLAALLGVGLGGGLSAAAVPIATALSSSPAVADLAATYLRIAGLGVPAMLLVLAATGALRGLLDLRTPLIVMIAANLLNAALTLMFVHGLDGGIGGAAWGLVIAQWFAAVALIAPLVRRSGSRPPSPHLGDIWRSALDGVPLLLRTVSVRIVFLVATLVAAGLGDAPLAAHQVATSVVTFLAFSLDALAIAAQTLTGRALGASDPDQARTITRRVIAWGAGFGLALGVALATTSSLIGPLFSADPGVQRALVPALVVIAVIQPVSGIVFVLDGVLIGAGDGRYLAWAALVTLGVHVPLALVVGLLDASFTWLWVVYSAYQLARWATLWPRQRGTRWMVLGAR